MRTVSHPTTILVQQGVGWASYLSLVVAVAALVAGPGNAHADEHVRSYAYVTGLETDYESAADPGVKENRCNVTARLPVAIVHERPEGNDQAILAGATLVEERVKDPEKHCEDYLHTWQPVSFDPSRRDDVHFDWPEGDIDSGHLVAGLLMLGVIGYVVFEPLWYRFRIRRRRHRRYQDDE